MKKIIAVCLLAFSLNAHAIGGFVMGMAMGSSMSHNKNLESVSVDVSKPTVICMAQYFTELQAEQCYDSGHMTSLGVYVARMGYRHYHKRELVFANTNYYLFLDVWN